MGFRKFNISYVMLKKWAFINFIFHANIKLYFTNITTRYVDKLNQYGGCWIVPLHCQKRLLNVDTSLGPTRLISKLSMVVVELHSYIVGQDCWTRTRMLPLRAYKEAWWWYQVSLAPSPLPSTRLNLHSPSFDMNVGRVCRDEVFHADQGDTVSNG